MKRWIVWSNSEDWLHNVIIADDEHSAYRLAHDDYQHCREWSNVEPDADGEICETLALLEWKDGTNAVEYFSDHEVESTMVYVFAPQREKVVAASE